MTTAAATTSRTMNRAQIIEMGRQGPPWLFLPVACQALRQIPQDTELRFFTAANFGRLGLKTAAIEHLDRLPPDAAQASEVVRLRAVLETLPDDRISRESRLSACRTNLAALARRGFDFSTEFATWAATAEATELFRATDGNVVRRARGERDGASWVHLSDIAGAAAAFIRDNIAEKPEALARPFTLEGCDPPWLLRALHGALARQPDGYWPAIRLVHRNVNEFLDGLSLAPLGEELAAERLSLFVGESAADDFAGELKARIGTTSCGPVLTTPGLRTRCPRALDSIVREADRVQVETSATLLREVEQMYGTRTRAWWGDRYRGALSGTGEPLRVLIPTCRYSTFIKHASADLCAALQANGFEARTLIEPDDSARFSTVAYMREFAEFKPDLVVLINYTRSNMNERIAAGAHRVIPQNVPYVCWLQDAMPHQFDPRVGAGSGELDFLAGYLHDDLFSAFGFPRGRAFAASMVASESKFHTGPVEPSLRQKFTCDVAYVSHHSEPPEAMHERLKRETGADPAIHRVFDALLPIARDLAVHPERQSLACALRAATERTLREHLGDNPPARTLSLVHKCYALPLADRFLRHETLRWAAEACDARGWKLHLYGRGWEKHPTFGKYAKGELSHDEELRAAYACARVHLHASSSVQLHQRLLECALSGGLMLSRIMQETVKALRMAAARAAVRRAEPTLPGPPGTLGGCAIADHPELMRWVSTLQRLRIDNPGSILHPTNGVAYAVDKDRLETPIVNLAGDVLGDLPETCFSCSEGLAELIGTYVENADQRSRVSASIASRVKDGYTHRRFASRLIEFVRDGLAD